MLNFLGLGFNFGARDKGLAPLLGSINTQFTLLNSTLQALTEISKAALTPSESVAAGVSSQLEGVTEQFAKIREASKAMDLSKPAEGAIASIGGVTSAVEGVVEGSREGSTGFGRMANSVLSGAGRMTGAMGWVGMALGPIISGLGEATETAGGMIDAVSGMPMRVGAQLHRLTTEGINLTNSLEGEAVGLGQTARQVGANLGYTGDHLRRFIGQATGMAMGLNIGADEAGRAIRAWDESAETLGATGLRSSRDVARLTAGLGINADMLRNSTLEMRNLGASSDQIHSMTSAFAQLGRDVGDVSGSLNQLPQIMQLLEQRRALGETPEQMTAFATDTAAAARGLFEFTQDSGRAMEMSSQLAQTVTESRTAFQNMFAGAETALPQLVTELSVVSGDVNDSFRLMQQGPGGLIEGMGELVQTTRAQGGNVERVLEFMRGRLQQVFGAEMTGTLVNFWRTMGEGTTSAMQSIRGASVSLADMGREAHTTGRTLDEVFERMRAGFQTAFRRVARPAVREFVRDTGQELRRLRRSMSAAANSGGALGTAMETMAMATQVGGLALLPEELRSGAVAADELFGMVSPLITSFTTWGGLVETVGSYIALFATRVIEAKTETNTWSQAIDQVATNFADVFVRWLGDAERFLIQLTDGFANFNWDNLFGGAGAQGTLAGAFQRVLSRLRDIDWGRIWKNLQEGFNELFERVSPWLEQKWDQLKSVLRELVKDWWDSIDWGAIIGELGDLASALWGAIQPALSQVLADVGAWFEDHWSEIVIGAALATAAAVVLALAGIVVLAAAVFFGPMISSLVYMWAWITEGWRAWGDDITAFFSDWWSDIRAFAGEFGQWFVGLWEGISSWFSSLLESSSDTFQSTWDHVAGFFTEVWEGVATFFSAVGEGIIDVFLAQWGRIFAVPGQVISFIQGLWQRYIQWFTQTFPETAQAVVEVTQVWRERFGEILEFAGEVWNSIGATVLGTVRQIEELVNTARRRTVGHFDDLRGRVLNVWRSIREGIEIALQYVRNSVIAPFINGVTAGFNAVSVVVTSVWESITATISGAITALRTAYIDPFFSAMETAWSNIQMAAGEIWQSITDVVALIGTGLVGAVTTLRSAWEGIVSFFGSVFARISETVRAALPSFNDLATGAVTALDSIMATVVRLFGHSVHTVVGEDMEQTEAIMTETAMRVSEMMQRVLHDATVEAIVTGFAEGFDAVADNMVDFSGAMVDQFEALAEGILLITTELFTSVVSQSEIAMMAIETVTEGIIGRLRSITEAQAALAEAREAAIGSLARPDDDEALRRRLAELGGSEVLQAIHYPDWYNGSAGQGGYASLFAAKMEQLHADLIALGAAVPSTALEDRRRVVREAREAIATSRVGHPATPGSRRRP